MQYKEINNNDNKKKYKHIEKGQAAYRDSMLQSKCLKVWRTITAWDCLNSSNKTQSQHTHAQTMKQETTNIIKFISLDMF